MQINKKINYIYEFKTPNGYFPIGAEYRSLPILFDHINELEYQHGTIAHRMGYSDRFKILNECASTYDVLTLGDIGIPIKMLSDHYCLPIEQRLKNIVLNIKFHILLMKQILM
jgi:hypothetical protein